MFDICVPSWNSLEYLKILHDGVKKNTKLKHQFFVHNNGSEDGTSDWLHENIESWTGSGENKGFTGVNHAIALGKNPYVIIMNTDMWPLPGWDMRLFKEIQNFKKKGIDKFTLSCCLIEPMGANPEYTIFNAGHDTQSFDEQKLVQAYFRNNVRWQKKDTTQYSHPILLPRAMLEDMNYLDEQYFPGWAVDHDLAAEAYKQGCRHFKMLGGSRVYHFISKTFTKLPPDIKNRHGEDVFEKKHGISVKHFRKELNIAQPYEQVKDGILL